MGAFAFAAVVGLAVSIALAAGYRAVLRLSPIHPLPLLLPPPPSPTGVYSPNSLLQGLRKLGEGRLPEPEDVAVDSLGRIYTGCTDGWLRRIWPDGKVEDWMHVGGRPVGLAIGLHQELLVCEPYQGLLNVTDGKVELLANEAEGLKLRVVDAVTVARDGSIYFTDASHKYGMDEHVLDVLECGSNGRLLKYDPATRSTTVLLKDLYFANGVALSERQDFLVFCETTLAQCSRYWLEGNKKGKREIFIDNLPAHPDNIKNGKGRFWIGLISSRSFMSNFVAKHPFLKQLVLVTKTMWLLDETKRSGWVLAVSEEGEATSLYGDPNGSVIRFVTTGLPVGDYLYLGNLGTNFVGRINLNSTY